MTRGDAAAPIEFVLGQDGGSITGQQVFFDPITGATVAGGFVTGQNVGDNAQWSSYGNGLVVNGTFTQASFKGTAQMMTLDGGTFQAALTLTRGAQ